MDSMGLMRKIYKRIISPGFVGDVFSAVFIRFGNMFLGFLTGAMLARMLGPAGRGELAAIQNWGMFIATIALMGLQDAVVYYIGRQQDKAGGYWLAGTVWALVSGLAFGVIGWSVMPFLLRAQSSLVIKTARWFIILLIPLYNWHWITLGVLRGVKKLIAWNLYQFFFPSLGWLVVLITMWQTNIASASSLAYGYLIIVLIVTLPAFVKVLTMVHISLDVNIFREMLKYASYLGVARIFHQTLLNGRVVLMFMGATQPPEILGFFSIAVSWGMISRPVNLAISSVILPYVVSSSGTQRNKYLTKGIFLSAVWVIGTSIILSLLASFGIPVIFGAAFSKAVPAAMIMVWANGVATMGETLAEGLQGLGRPESVLRSEFVGFVLTLLLLIIRFRSLDAIGGAWASLIGYSGAFVVMLWNIRGFARKALISAL